MSITIQNFASITNGWAPNSVLETIKKLAEIYDDPNTPQHEKREVGPGNFIPDTFSVKREGNVLNLNQHTDETASSLMYERSQGKNDSLGTMHEVRLYHDDFGNRVYLTHSALSPNDDVNHLVLRTSSIAIKGPGPYSSSDSWDWLKSLVTPVLERDAKGLLARRYGLQRQCMDFHDGYKTWTIVDDSQFTSIERLFLALRSSALGLNFSPFFSNDSNFPLELSALIFNGSSASIQLRLTCHHSLRHPSTTDEDFENISDPFFKAAQEIMNGCEPWHTF